MLASSDGMPSTPSIREYMLAAMIRNRMAAVTRPVSEASRHSTGSDSLPFSAAMTMAAKAPAAPASVGVKMPP